MSVERLVIHMGMPKTGTSILQSSIIHALRMPEAGHLIYPELGRDGGIAHHELVKHLSARNPYRGRNAGEGADRRNH
jgi:hypothetical protein